MYISAHPVIESIGAREGLMAKSLAATQASVYSG
jgi:hypothetical protein